MKQLFFLTLLISVYGICYSQTQRYQFTNKTIIQIPGLRTEGVDDPPDTYMPKLPDFFSQDCGIDGLCLKNLIWNGYYEYTNNLNKPEGDLVATSLVKGNDWDIKISLRCNFKNAGSNGKFTFTWFKVSSTRGVNGSTTKEDTLGIIKADVSSEPYEPGSDIILRHPCKSITYKKFQDYENTLVEISKPNFDHENIQYLNAIIDYYKEEPANRPKITITKKSK